MSLITKVLLKVREGRGKKPLFKRHRKESLVTFMFRVISKKPKLNKAISDLINPKPRNLPLFELTKRLRNEQEKNTK
jgi:hypothetical protein